MNVQVCQVWKQGTDYFQAGVGTISTERKFGEEITLQSGEGVIGQPNTSS
jgi:hypothetical protein